MTRSTPPTAADLSDDLDAALGTVHRDLTNALRLINVAERLVHRQRRVISMDIQTANEALAAAAADYVAACDRNDTPAMTRAFAVLRQGVTSWRAVHARETKRVKTPQV